MTQADLARASGLSPATVSSIARELRDDGWLVEDEGDGAAAALALDRSAGVAVGIDFGHSHVRVAIADLAHTVLAEAEEPLDVDHEAGQGIELAGRDGARGCSARSGSRAGASPASAWALPGPLRRDTGEVGDSAILPGWIGARPEELMREELGLAVRVENDANLGALAEIVWGAGRGCWTSVRQGRHRHRRRARAQRPAVPRRGGHRGGDRPHDDRRVAAPSAAAATAAAWRRSRAPRRCSSRCAAATATELTLREVVARAHEGDLGCTRVIADAGRALGVAIAGVCNLLAPERVIVGGELAQAGELLVEPVRAMVRRSAIAATRDVRSRPACSASAPRCSGRSRWCCGSRGSASSPSRRPPPSVPISNSIGRPARGL